MANTVASVHGQIYDHIYIQSWKAVIAECEEKLENYDREVAGGVKGAGDFRTAVNELVDEFTNDALRQVVILLLPTIEHYEMFANTFVAMMAQAVDVSMLWGLLFLVVKISLESAGTIERISGMLRGISYKVQLINECFRPLRSLNDVKLQTLELNREIVFLWLDIITMFRNQGPDFFAWEKITLKYNEASRSLSEAAKHFEGLIRLAKMQSRMIDLAMFRDHLPLQSNGLQNPSFPCNNIPIPRNKRFFGREVILQQIEEHLQPAATNRGVSSVALYGLHGIGKSQIALYYAFNKLEELDAVLWVSGESELAMKQSLSDIALETLRLPGAQARSQQENAILVMYWLKTTNAKWLLIYDNITTTYLFEKYWPVARHGSILITTNHRTLASQPVDQGIEVREFNPDEGASFLVQSIPERVVKKSDQEFQAAITLSKKLGGHALGISQMAALINSRRESIEKFLVIYDKDELRCHQERKNGWKYAGYNHCLANIWVLSFRALKANDRLCLGVLCFFMPDSIPSAVFEVSDRKEIPAALKFCSNDFTRGEVIEHLSDLALIRHDSETDALSVHRLVQVQFLFHMEGPDRQEAFDAAVKLLLERFPSRGESRVIDKDWPIAERYTQHVLALTQSYRDARMKQEPLRSSGDLCNLICDVTWYLTLNDTANNLGIVLTTGFDAYQDWDGPSKDVLIKAYLLCNSALHDLDLGEFHIALTRTQECLTIQLSKLDPDHEQILNSYNNLGIAHGSMAKYDRGLDFLDRAEAILKTSPDQNPAKSVLLNVNMGRNHYCMGSFNKARGRLEAAMADSVEMDSWYWKVLVHLAFASLFCRTGELDKAENHTQLAKDIIDNSGAAQTTRLNGFHAYRAGRVALAQDRFEESITHLEKANAIDQVLNRSPGHRARTLFALSIALQAVDKRRDEGLKRGLEAAKFREAARHKAPEDIPDDETFEAFDLLVKILDR